MTDREKAIIMAFTGTVTLRGDDLGIYYQYVKEILGRPIFTHELHDARVLEQIMEKSKADFLKLLEGPGPMTAEKPEPVQSLNSCGACDIPAELKKEQARLMTLDEVKTAEDCMEPVFLEMLDENGLSGETPDIFSWRFVKHITPATGGNIYMLMNYCFNSALWTETYGITWRCWTSRPTYEQRKAVKWDG